MPDDSTPFHTCRALSFYINDLDAKESMVDITSFPLAKASFDPPTGVRVGTERPRPKPRGYNNMTIVGGLHPWLDRDSPEAIIDLGPNWSERTDSV